jgi:cytochrome P450
VTCAADLDLPDFASDDSSLTGDQLHAALRELASTSWLARGPNGYLTLDRDAGEFFLRCRTATFPGQMIAEMFGIGPGPLREEIDNNILHLDGDRHRRLRNLLNPFFTPRAADRWRPLMREIVEEICAGWIGSGRCEFVSSFAKPYPAQVIAAVVGAPRDDWPMLHEWSHWMQSQFDGPALLNDRARIERAVIEFYDWCDALLSRRRDSPADDLVSMLMSAAGNEKLSDVELRNLVLDIIAGGVDTTHAQLAHALRLFAEHPEQWALLASTPELAPQAVEEVLRHEPVTPFGARILTADVTYRDVTFAAGTVMLIGAAVANRETADSSFDITAGRDGERILTFGAGTHFCVGANLARAELQEALTYLAPRMPALRLDGQPEFGTVQGIYGLPSLPIAWGASANR